MESCLLSVIEIHFVYGLELITLCVNHIQDIDPSGYFIRAIVDVEVLRDDLTHASGVPRLTFLRRNASAM